jgi:penicillin G amidase
VKRRQGGKIILFTIYLLVTAGLTYLLHNPQGPLPPPGKFFDPFGGFWQNAEGPLLYKSNELSLTGLEGAVTVNFDERMVPHVFAENLHDVYYMQGFVTAKARLWQMDMQARAAAGRLAEVAGEKALPLDILARRLGLPKAARLSESLMIKDPVSKEILQAYSAGVNAWISQLEPADFPFEFKLLNYRPEPWSPYKTALLLKYMANMLTGYELDLEYTNALSLFGEETFYALFPEIPDTLLDPVIPQGTLYKKPAFVPVKPLNKIDSGHSAHLYTPLPEKSEPDLGSNNWAVSGSRTKHGSPILCNDPHLALNLPSIWYEIQLHAPGLNVYGASIPGAPCVLTGFNDSIAWGITNAAMDVKDWYKIRFRDAGKSEYLFDGKWKKTEKKIERFDIKGMSSVYDTIIYTHLGPVSYDDKYKRDQETENLALRWTAHMAGNELLTFHLLNKAGNYSDYAAALNHYRCPGQNFVFASASGDIAIRQQGLFVNRYPGQGRFVMDGTSSETAWQNFIPDSANPSVKNPLRGWVSSANQHPADSTWPYYYHGIYEFYRNRRINQQLSMLNKAGTKEMMRLQNDNFNLYASESLPMLLRHLDLNKLSREDRQWAGFLMKWNFLNEPGKVAPIIFETWWKHFLDLLWDEFVSEEKALSRPGTFQTIRFLQKFPSSEFIDNKSTPEIEDLDVICLNAYLAALNEIRIWQAENPGKSLNWAHYKGTEIQHLSRQKAFGVENLFVGGNAGIVNAISKRNGPSWRMVVSPGVKNEAFGIYPGGQSGNPGSRFYDNFISDWSIGKYYTLRMLPAEEKDKRIYYILHAHRK